MRPSAFDTRCVLALLSLAVCGCGSDAAPAADSIEAPPPDVDHADAGSAPVTVPDAGDATHPQDAGSSSDAGAISDAQPPGPDATPDAAPDAHAGPPLRRLLYTTNDPNNAV